jgi:glutamate-1-semialdehyde 2,1-aminomutase
MGSKSRTLFAEAQKVIPGGVNSPVRAFKAVGGDPLFFARGAGALMYDVDGAEYIDYVCSWGPLILGHAHDAIVREVREAAGAGTSFGAPNAHEVELAQMVVEAFPGIDKVRLVNSGTEATLSALRLARGFTGRELVVKMEGCYHGHVDALLANAGSGVATLAIPGTPGVSSRVVEQTLVVPYNDLGAVERLAEERGSDIACLIVEPIAANMGVVPPAEGYLAGLRKITARHGIVLIFDEVISGFRVALGGAQQRYGVTPDLTTLGKILGGGLPIGAYGGRADIMSRVAPEGDVYQAGTLSGNPLAVRAGIVMLKALRAAGVYDRLETSGKRLGDGLRLVFEDAGLPTRLNRIGSLMTMFFCAKPPFDWTTASASDGQRYGAFFRGMLKRGVYLAPSQFEAMFVSLAHDDALIDRTLDAARETLKEMR